MVEPVKKGLDLIREIDAARAARPTLWWLGQSGFVLKYRTCIFYIDPYLSDSQRWRYRHSGISRERLVALPLRPSQVRHADLVFATHAHGCHLDSGTLPVLMRASRGARLVLPKRAAGRAQMMGIDYLRMTTTDVDLPVDFWKDGCHVRIEPVASAHEQLDYSPHDGHPYLGYLIHFGAWTIYHSGDCVLYEGLVERLRRASVTLALLPISGRNAAQGIPGNFTILEAAQLAEDIGATWLTPMHYGMFESTGSEIDRFIDHMLGCRPGQRFKVFECGEMWELPD